MRQLTVILEDEELYSAIETEARSTGHTVEDVVVQALRQWHFDCELDIKEKEELGAARREWEEIGGMEAHEFFENLRNEELGDGE